MDTLTYEQIKELQEHQPIPRGGWKLLGGTLWALVLMASGVGTSLALMWALDGHVPGNLNVHIGAVVGAAIAIGVAIHAISGDRMRWCEGNWNRNTRGYAVRFFWTTDGEKHRELTYRIDTRRDNADFRHMRTGHMMDGESLIISLPLGGWFARPWILVHGRDETDRLQGWSVRLRAILHTGAVMVEIRKRNRRWGVNERIVMDIGSALRHFEAIANNPNLGCWSDVIARLTSYMDYEQGAREKLERQKTALFGILMDAAGNPSINPPDTVDAWMERQCREVARLAGEHPTLAARVSHLEYVLKVSDRLVDRMRRELDLLVRNLQSVARMFQESSRFRETIEGLRLYVEILTALLDLHPELLPKEDRTALTDALALAKARLAEKEEEDRRGRHRRRRKPAPAAAS